MSERSNSSPKVEKKTSQKVEQPKKEQGFDWGGWMQTEQQTTNNPQQDSPPEEGWNDFDVPKEDGWDDWNSNNSTSTTPTSGLDWDNLGDSKTTSTKEENDGWEDFEVETNVKKVNPKKRSVVKKTTPKNSPSIKNKESTLVSNESNSPNNQPKGDTWKNQWDDFLNSSTN